MSIHINMTPEAEAELRETARRNRLASFLVCLVCIALGGAALYFSVVMLESEKLTSFIRYVPPNDIAPPNTTPKVRQLKTRPASPASSVAPNVIVAASTSPVAMADVDVPVANVEFGAGTDINMGMGASFGTDISDGGGGMGWTRGGGSTLVGNFYDLKQTRQGARTDNATWTKGRDPRTGETIDIAKPDNAKVVSALHDFIANDWDSKILNKYYKAKTPLYASNFYMPHANASYAPFAYRCADKVQPSGWVAIYRGKVVAPKTGKFRFVGLGDEVLAVRFNRKTVLEWGYCNPTENMAGASVSYPDNHRKLMDKVTKRPQNPVTFYKYTDADGGGVARICREIEGLACGAPFEVTEGKTYPIEIMLAETAGGLFGFVLLIEDLDAPATQKTKSGQPLLQLFRTNFAEPDAKKIRKELRKLGSSNNQNFNPVGDWFPYDKDSLIWTSVP